MKRKEENEQDNIIVPIRSERLFTQNAYWYFRTREGMEIGPFDTAEEATEGINGFIDFLTTSQPDVIEKVNDYVSSAA